LNSLYIACAVVGTVAAGCLLLGIINWVTFAASSSRAAELEDEVSKKTAEFDALRKELQRLKDGREQAASAADDSHVAYEASPGIQTMRNVREGLAPTSDELAAMRDHPLDEHGNAVPADGHAVAAREAALPRPTSAPAEYDATPHSASAVVAPVAAASLEDDRDVLDVVDKSQSGAMRPAPHSQAAIDVGLFSPAKKDADFAKAWELIKEALTTRSKPYIRLDFTGILFLYEQEIDYLQRMVQAVGDVQGMILFVNCQRELHYIFLNYPMLSQCLEGT
jgi:hypothetical protein